MEDALHCNFDSVVVRVDRFWVMRPAGWVERLSGGQGGFDSFVSEDEQRSHCSERAAASLTGLVRGGSTSSGIVGTNSGCRRRHSRGGGSCWGDLVARRADVGWRGREVIRWPPHSDREPLSCMRATPQKPSK